MVGMAKLTRSNALSALAESQPEFSAGTGRFTIGITSKEGVNYHELLLRKDNDMRQDAIVKREILQRLDKSRILFVVEDRSRVVEMWRAEGLTCLQCAPGEF